MIYLLAGGFLVMAAYGVSEFFRGHKDLGGETPAGRFTTNELIDTFENDSAGSNRLYVGKVVTVQGRITHLQADDNPVVISLGEEGQLSSVQCSMDSVKFKASPLLATGSQVTIKGICTGAIRQEFFGTDVKLSRCLIDGNPR